MGWFDSQIKERLEHDEDLVSQAAWDLSVGHHRAGGRAARKWMRAKPRPMPWARCWRTTA